MSAGTNLGMNLATTKTASADGFDPAFYLAQRPDVAQAGVDPLQHYLQYGINEGAFPNAEAMAVAKGGTAGGLSAKDQKSVDAYASNPYGFDPNFYLAERPDVAKAKQDPLQHYLQYGMAEGTPRNAYVKTYGMPGASDGGVAPPPATAPTLNPNDPSSWAAWSAKAAAQTQGLNRMPNVAPTTDTLSADPLAVKAQFYPKGNNAGFQYPGMGMAPAATDPMQMTPEMLAMVKNLGMKL
jgi:hypothetical protein